MKLYKIYSQAKYFSLTWEVFMVVAEICKTIMMKNYLYIICLNLILFLESYRLPYVHTQTHIHPSTMHAVNTYLIVGTVTFEISKCLKQKTEVIHIVVGAGQGQIVLAGLYMSNVCNVQETTSMTRTRLPVNMRVSPLQVTHLQKSGELSAVNKQ